MPWVDGRTRRALINLPGTVTSLTVPPEFLVSGAAHEFEVLDPDGEALGEVAAIAAGDTGGATLSFESPGVYTYQCILIDADTGKEHTELGMIGTFRVSDG